MIVPIRTDYQMSTRPYVNYGLMAANILIFALGYNGSSAEDVARMHHLLLQPDQPALWQFVTSVFLHGSLLHLLGNMVFLWVFGSAINDRLGHVGYLAFYLAGGIFAGVGYLVFSGDAPVLGASGAIASVTGAYLVLFPRTRVTLIVWLFYVLMPLEVSSLYFLLLQLLFELYMSAQISLAEEGMGVTVAHWAHSSGYLFGMATAAGLLATGLLPRDVFDLPNLIRNVFRRNRYKRMVNQGYDPFGYGARRGSGRATPPRPVDADAPSRSTPKELQLRSEIASACNDHDLPGAAAKYLQLVQVADDATLPQQYQVDVANELMAEQRYPQAADAYEKLLARYPHYEHTADIKLMLGLIYARYLQQYDRAETLLTDAADHLHDARKRALAMADLDRVRRQRE